jgi:hypothetical protein
MRHRFPFMAALAALGLVASALPAQASVDFFNPAVSSFANVTTGWYDHEQIWYEGSSVVKDPTAAANLAAQGQVVYHVESPDGSTSPLQISTLPTPATGGITASGNVLSAIPTEVGYNGGAWNLKIFVWNSTPTRALTQDDDILAAAANGEGTLLTTDVVVRCPLVNFTALR